ncbi:hypothetical protein FACS1894152_2530 [Bacilli bacterium]|nr:hypothetical protein FACS1894152_2530 [Bacilli bacterium]
MGDNKEEDDKDENDDKLEETDRWGVGTVVSAPTPAPAQADVAGVRF